MDSYYDGPGPDAIYSTHLAEGRFMIQKCGACAGHVFYPRLLCPQCGQPALEFVPASGKGVIYSTTVQRRRLEQGGDQSLVLVDLAEGPRMMARVDGMAPGDVRPGLEVEAQIIDEGGRRFVVFTPA